MIIRPRVKGFICTTAHPAGCLRRVEEDIACAQGAPGTSGPRRVLVLGASGGYGLATRVAAAFGWGADTVGVSFEREATEAKVGTAGHYNTVAFDRLAADKGLRTASINSDAFSNEGKARTLELVRETFGGEPVDLVVYSLAAPRRTDPATGEAYSSVIKPIGGVFTGKNVDTATGAVSEVSLQPATEEETAATVKVMGGEDWLLWMQVLSEAGLLAEHCVSLAFSYIGPDKTHAIYKDGTIGQAKLDLEAKQREIDALLAPLGGKAYVSVNKALVTQASSAIPVVPLYISLLYRVMQDVGSHEDCQKQMNRLLHRLYPSALTGDFSAIPTDKAGRLRLDDWEMRPEVQAEVDARWQQVTGENIEALGDLEEYRKDFLRIFGFGLEDVDYEADISPIL